ncbi:MAG: PEGA domain-containing protein, partial [Methanoregulaceae archaeon]|nr:PEGA domain-containing protein [Methanoregulaceae archaeon]
MKNSFVNLRSLIFVSLVLLLCVQGVMAEVTYTITASAGPHGSITFLPVNSPDVLEAGTKIAKITPDNYYDILDVLVDGSSVGAVSSYTFNRVYENHTISAQFTPQDGGLYVMSIPEGADIYVDGVKTPYQTDFNFPIPAGDHTITLKKTGYRDWSDTVTIDPGQSKVIAPVTLVPATQPPTTTAVPTTTTPVPTTTTPVPTTQTPRYTITVTQALHGAITPGTVMKNEGASQTFTITPANGYRTGAVMVDGVSAGGVPSYAFTNIRANHTLTATFAQIPATRYTITVTQALHGTISPGTVTKNAGESQTFTITPASGYHIGSVVVDGVSVGAVSSYPFTGISSNHTITASYLLNTVPQYTITVIQTIHGTITPGTVVKNKGDSQTFSITADSNYILDQLIVDGSIVAGAPEIYTLTNIQANHVITAVYAANPVTLTPTTYPTVTTTSPTTIPTTSVTTIPPVTTPPTPGMTTVQPTIPVTQTGTVPVTLPITGEPTPGQNASTNGTGGEPPRGVSTTDLLSVLPTALIPLAFLFSRDLLKSGGTRLTESRRTRALTGVFQALCGISLLYILNWFVRAGPGLATELMAPAIVFAMLLLTYGAFSALAVSSGLIISRPLQSTLRVHIIIGVLIPLFIPIL